MILPGLPRRNRDPARFPSRSSAEFRAADGSLVVLKVLCRLQCCTHLQSPGKPEKKQNATHSSIDCGHQKKKTLVVLSAALPVRPRGGSLSSCPSFACLPALRASVEDEDKESPASSPSSVPLLGSSLALECRVWSEPDFVVGVQKTLRAWRGRRVSLARGEREKGRDEERLGLDWTGRRRRAGRRREERDEVGDGGVRASHLQLQQLPLPCGGARRRDLQGLPGVGTQHPLDPP